MGLPSYPNAHDGLVPMLVVSAVMAIVLLRNSARSLLGLDGGASSSQAEEAATSAAAAVCPEVTDAWTRVSVSRFRALCGDGNDGSKGGAAVGGGWRGGGGGTGAERCCVCLCGFEEEEEVSELRCRHYFHEACLKEWFDNLCTIRKLTCPLCRCLL